MAVMLGLTLALGLGGIVQAQADLSSILRDRLERRGIAIAYDLAARGADLLLINNIFDLYELVNDTLINNDDVRYVLIIDQSERVRVHTFEKGVPEGLLVANRVLDRERHRTIVIETEEGPIQDIAVPIFGGKAGTVRVGMSEKAVHAAVADYLRKLGLLLVAVAIAGLVAAYTLATFLTRPIFHLVEAAKAVAKGDLSVKANVRTRDEIGKLGAAFDAMTEELARSREEVIGRNKELEALNAIAATVSRSLDLNQVLNGAMSKVLEVTGVEAGWVFLVEGDDGKLSLAAYAGLSESLIDDEKIPHLHDCPCTEVLRTGETIVANGLPKCRWLRSVAEHNGGFRSHASIPLKSKDKVLGIMNIASKEVQRFTADEIRLLSAIGHQVAVAIENARLYAEVQRKEEIRGQLLEKIISVQEEERKRIARELHDDSAQALTALLMTLEAAETTLPPEFEQLRERLGRIKLLTVRALGEIRRLILDLRPASLDDLGLVAAIRWYAENYLENLGIKVNIDAASFRVRLPAEIETALFRIVQEAINNIAKHARASYVKIRIELVDSRVIATVEDDGQGFNVESALGTQNSLRGLGLLGMQERVELLGGSISVRSEVGKGTTISVAVPVRLEAKAN